MKKIFLVILILLLNENLSAGELRGKITERNSPLLGVNVYISSLQKGDVTDESGFYLIKNLAPGNYQVRFSAVGYKTLFFDVTIETNKITELNAEMESTLIEVDEVEILGNKVQRQNDTRTSVIDLEPQSVKILPGAVTDVLRSLQSLPGVLAPNDFSSQLIIRGSGPDQNLIIMDDVEIFNPYRLYGVISMFNPEAVSAINLITGGFPAKYGDRLSAVLDVTNREGDRYSNFAGNLNANIVSANLVLEGKNPFNLPGSWLVNSRRTYYDLIIEPFVKSAGLVEDNVTFPNFYDIQAKLSFGPFNGHKFLLNGVYSRDGVDVVSPPDRNTVDSVSVFNISQNDLASFAWHFAPNKRTLNKLIVSWYRNGGDTDFDSQFLDPTLNRDDFEDVIPDTIKPYLLGFGLESNITFRKYSFDNKVTHFWGKGNEFNAGVGLDLMRTNVTFDFQFDPLLEAIFRANPNFRSSTNDLSNIQEYRRYRAFVENNFSIGDRLFFNPGLRFDYYDILEKYYLSPRISLSFAIDKLTTVRAFWGNYFQSPGYEKLRDQNVVFDFSRQYTQDLEAERSTHYVLSLERWLNNEWKAKFETYYKSFDDLIFPKVVQGNNFTTSLIAGKDPRFKESWTQPIAVSGDSVTTIPANNSTGEAYGFEFLLEKRNITGDNKLSGWVSYALAYANRIEDGFTYPFRFDQRHTINVVLNYKPSSWFDVGLRFQYGSGFPNTQPIGIKPRIILSDSNNDGIGDTPEIATRKSIFNPNATENVIFNLDFGSKENRFSSRKPDYHRLDIRFSFYADYWGYDWVFYLDVINVYNRSNVVGYDYSIDENLEVISEKNTMFPIIPTLGFNVRF